MSKNNATGAKHRLRRVSFLRPLPPLHTTPCQGLTPETFWENSERLVRLANSGDRAEFEGVMDELLAKSKLRTSAPDSANQQNKAPGMALTDGGSSNYSMANKGGDGGEADVWRPGGPLFHAALGKTGDGKVGIAGWKGHSFLQEAFLAHLGPRQGAPAHRRIVMEVGRRSSTLMGV